MNIAELSIKRPVLVIMIVLAVITLGILGYSNLSVDLMPNIDFPVIVVNVAYPGISTEEIESLFIKPLENALGSVAGLDTMTSLSYEGQAMVILQFKLDTDIKFAELNVREKVQAAQPNLPEDADSPRITRFSMDDTPIVRLSLSGNRTAGDLRDILDATIVPQIEGLPGVGTVNIDGSRKKQIQIEVDHALLAANGITYNQIITAIQRRNISIPVGLVKGKDKNVIVRVSGKTESIEDIKKINLTSYSGKILRIGDIASIKPTLEEETSRARVNGKPAILFSIVKQSGENTIKVAKTVRAKLDELNKHLPAGVQVKMVSDSSEPIQRSINGVQDDILIGMLLAIIIVWLFLGNFRSTIITAIALPNSLLGAFVLISGAGFSINTITLMALSLAVGLLVDDSIVVRENIFRYIEHGETPQLAAIKGTNEVALAVLSTTLSIMAVFIPISFMNGIIGKFFKQFGLTVAFALLISLLDAFTTAPMLSAYWYHDSKKEAKSFIGKAFNRLAAAWNKMYARINAGYGKILEWSLNHKKTVLTSIVILFFVCIGASFFVGSNYINPIDGGYIYINLSAYPGAPLDKIDNIAKDIEGFLAKQADALKDYYTIAGGDRGSQKAYISVDLVPLNKRKISTAQLATQIRNYIKDKFAQQLQFTVSEATAMGSMMGGSGSGGGMGGGGAAISINIIGLNLDTLNDLSRSVVKAVSAVPGAIDVASSYALGSPEWVLELDSIKAEKVGLTVAELGGMLRALVSNANVSIVTLSDNDYRIILQMNKQQLTNEADIKNLIMTTRTGKKVPLSSICNITNSASPQSIMHESKQRVVRVTANIAPDYAIADVMAGIRKNIDNQKLVSFPEGYTYAFSGQQKIFGDMGQQILLAILLSVLFMYMILSSLYNSLKQPLYIMISLPLTFIGAYLGLLLTGINLDIYGYIGLIMVIGLAAKNAILLLDFTNKKRAEGMPIREAILHAGPVRLRPILMTSFAIIFGMLPMALGLNEGSTGRQALPITVIGGIFSSTFLTLVVIPIIYEWAERIGERRKAKRSSAHMN